MQTTAGRLRVAVECCVWLLLAGLTVETWFIAGAASSWRVVGGSMAGSLLGDHRESVCPVCGFPFAIGVESDALPARIACPNCGHCQFRSLTEPAYPSGMLSDILPGDRMLVDRLAFEFRPPRRWEIVAFRHPQHAKLAVVKRIVGLPGETVEIRDGDIFINGKMLRKNLPEQHALRVLVHDASFQPPSDDPHWRPLLNAAGWRENRGVFSHASNTAATSADWLAYYQQNRLVDGRSCAIPDVSSYNQMRSQRDEDVHAVHDLAVSMRLKDIVGAGVFCVRLGRGDDVFDARLTFDGENGRRWSWAVLQNEKKLAKSPGFCSLPFAMAAEGLTVEASLIDRQFLLAVGGEVLATIPLNASTGNVRHSPQKQNGMDGGNASLAIGVERLGVRVATLCVWRDTYYGGRRRTTLGRDEYFVLGDNSAVSEDSRTFAGRGEVSRNLLLGKPVMVISSVGRTKSYFQVPNFKGMQYK